MADNRIYRSGGVWKRILIAAFALILATVVIWVGVFFYFRRYVVYSDGSAYLDIPWLDEFNGSGGDSAAADNSDADIGGASAEDADGEQPDGEQANGGTEDNG